MIVGQRRLLESGQVILAGGLPQPHGAVNCQGSVGVHHQLHVRAKCLPRQPQTLQQTLRKVRVVQAGDTNLDGLEAFGSLAEDLVGGPLRGCPPTAGVRRHSLAHSATQQPKIGPPRLLP